MRNIERRRGEERIAGNCQDEDCKDRGGLGTEEGKMASDGERNHITVGTYTSCCCSAALFLCLESL